MESVFTPMKPLLQNISTTGTGCINYVPYQKPKLYIGDTLTENDLSKEVLDELRKQVRFAQSRQFDAWTDYTSVIETDSGRKSM